jgi:hypothetical protein
VYHDLDGVEASLFHYKGEWLLASKWAADASQPLLDIIDRRKGKHHNPFSFLEEQLQDACEGTYTRIRHLQATHSRVLTRSRHVFTPARIVKETEEVGRADGVRTVSDLFWDVWNANKDYALPDEDDQDKCFTFDVCSRRFPHVVRHGDEEGQARERIVLHSVRDLNTLVRLPFLSLWMSADLTPVCACARTERTQS